MNNIYSHTEIEEKWQKKWGEAKVYSPDLDLVENPYFNLMMFPYPSAEGLHVGNMYAFTGTDVFGRFMRMKGNDVFEPIGLDGFGIHSENYAMKVGRHPKEQAERAEQNYYRQLRSIGNGFDWTRTVETYNPDYYKWTQWIFIQMFKKGLAYRKKADVNWCPSCKTVLSDEQVIQGKCERCSSDVEKRALEQWFFRITQYADRLLNNIDGLNWTEKVKIAQRNWIGKSVGARLTFKVEGLAESLEVFTTRPDTLHGATFMVIAPEHYLVSQIPSVISDQSILDKVSEYIKSSQIKSDIERTAEGKEKTGIFSGLSAVNPVTGEKIPIWIADYVLAGYGTGAIMAVPSHDERDFAFAKKYDLPIRQVVMPENGIKKEHEERRDGGAGVIFDPKRQKYAVALWPERGSFLGLFAGGIEKSEDEERGVLREITEESGLHAFKHVEKIGMAFAHFYSGGRKVNRVAKAAGYLVILESDEVVDTHLEVHEKFSLEWKTPEEILQNWNAYSDKPGIEHWIRFLKQGVARAIELGYDTTSNPDTYKSEAYSGEGILIDSGDWDGLHVPSEIPKVITWLEENKIGKPESQYHLRDWLISRQRYWGPPIPMIYCPTCSEGGKGEREDMPGWYSESEEHLPVALPDVEDWKPMGTGKAPLANHPEFFKTQCPSCGSDAVRETDVSDTFLDSAWYFLRYTSTDIQDRAFDRARVKRWLPVHSYIGGAEHSVLHLLYSRFLTMVLKDIGLIDFEEPFARFFAHGLIIKDGAKMSKSKGNVVVPDEYIAKYGADTLRLYLMFLGPFSDGGDFRDSGIEGMNRFVKRVWKMLSSDFTENSEPLDTNAKRIYMMHKTIKKVSEDINSLAYNTAIASLMEWSNFLTDLIRDEKIHLTKIEAETFTKLLAPFAPHFTEELWQTHFISQAQSKAFNSLHTSAWPEFDPKKIIEETITIPVQVNGKTRGFIVLPQDRIQDQSNAEHAALLDEKILGWVGSQKNIKKTIYIPGKIINFVV